MPGGRRLGRRKPAQSAAQGRIRSARAEIACLSFQFLDLLSRCGKGGLVFGLEPFQGGSIARQGLGQDLGATGLKLHNGFLAVTHLGQRIGTVAVQPMGLAQLPVAADIRCCDPVQGLMGDDRLSVSIDGIPHACTSR